MESSTETHILEQLSALRATQRGQSKLLVDLHKAVFVGNGEPGLLSTVAKLDNRVAHLERVPKTTASMWQPRYAKGWPLFIFGMVCGMNLVWDVAVRLYPWLVKLYHLATGAPR